MCIQETFWRDDLDSCFVCPGALRHPKVSGTLQCRQAGYNMFASIPEKAISRLTLLTYTSLHGIIVNRTTEPTTSTNPK